MTDDLESAVRAALAEDSTISTACTGTDGTVRIYAVALKQESGFPAITFHRVSTVRNESVGSYRHSGDPAGYSGRAWARVSFTIWSPEFSDTVQLGSALVKLLHSLDLTDSGHSSTKILIDRDAGREPESEVYERVIDAQIWFVEST
jgi:hypothetical protein